MNISPTPEPEQLVADKVKSGMNAFNPSEETSVQGLKPSTVANSPITIGRTFKSLRIGLKLVTASGLPILNRAEVTAKAVEMATKMLDYETATYSLGSFRKTPQATRSQESIECIAVSHGKQKRFLTPDGRRRNGGPRSRAGKEAQFPRDPRG